MTVRLQGAGLTFASGPTALTAIDLQVAPGEQLAIIGPSGAGKSSLLQLMATALPPTAGDITVLDHRPWSLDVRRRQRLRAHIGLIWQAPPLPPRQRVVTAVLAGRLGQWSLLRALASLIHPLDASGARTALARLDLADRLYARCDALSGGQLQRAAIARVLYQQPALVLADEPVSALDPALAAHTLGVLCDDARSRGATLVASLHAVDLALALFPRVIGLRDGRIVFDRASSAVTRDDLAVLYSNQLYSNPFHSSELFANELFTNELSIRKPSATDSAC